MRNIRKRLLEWCPQPKTSAPTGFTGISRHLRNSKLLYAIPATLIIVAIIGLVIFTGAQMAKSVRDFDLVFRYGVGAKNELNTFNGTFTHDMVMDPSITTDLELSIYDKWQILQKINEVNFFNLPSSYPKETGRWMSTQVDNYIRVQYGSQVKEISWNDNSHIDSNVQNLQQLARFVIEIIQDKAEYKALPTPRAGYA